MKTILAFVGTGKYETTRYDWPGLGNCKTRYASCAMASIWGADHIRLLATEEARQKHGDGIAEECRHLSLPVPEIIPLPTGRSQDELWGQFEVLRQALDFTDQTPPAAVLVDITHGFRAQPFFAGAALSVLRASGTLRQPVQLAYGELRKDQPTSPIWDLTLFLELTDWAQALRMFLESGVTGPLLQLSQQQLNDERQRVIAAGGRDFPRFEKLVKAIAAFGDDLSTVRTASIITGFEQDARRKAKARGTARQLCEAIASVREEVRAKVPPLALILDQLESEVHPLVADRLAGPPGQQAMAALASHYLRQARYAEAAIVAREAAVSRHATGNAGVEVNAPEFSREARAAADHAFTENDPHYRSIASVRNDIQHGGFNEQPTPADSLQRQVRELVEHLAATGHTPAPAGTPAAHSKPGRTWFVTRHPGARDWLEAQGIPVDEIISHLDPEDLQPGDRLIGTLPVHLAAAVCARGCQYLHLTMNVPEALRGRELTAADMDACGARVVGFRVVGDAAGADS